jgi:2-iminobutanoate/2-iminopropanoate deaminase
MKFLATPLLLISLLAGCSVEPRRVVSTDKAPRPVGPYSQAVMAGGRLYVSGQIALRPDGSLDTSSVESECRQVMENVRSVVESAGMTMGRISKVTVYTTDLSYFGTINAVYGGYFESDPPARETIQVSALPKRARIEISVIAD